jgi:phenylacetic acid degradation protein
MPNISSSAYIAPTAFVFGDVTIGPDCSIWPGASLRADMGPIVVGQGSSIQDSCALHLFPGGRVELGRLVTVGHGAVLHGCRVGDYSVIGMNATVLDGAEIGRGCVVGAGAVVKGGARVPDGALALGNPAQIKEGRPGGAAMNWLGALTYIALGRLYKEGRTYFTMEDITKKTEELKKDYPPP